MLYYVKIAGLIVAGAAALGGSTVAAVKKIKSAKKEKEEKDANDIVAELTDSVDSDMTVPIDSTDKPNQETQESSIENNYVNASDYDPSSVSVEDDLV